MLGACASPPYGDPIAAAMADADLGMQPGDLRAAYCDLRTGRTILYRANEIVHAASTMKLAVMIEVFRQADRYHLDLDEPIPIVNRFRSLVDASPYELSNLQDSEAELYSRIGQTMPIRELTRRMIVQSSNLATNLLIARVGADRVQATVEGLGARRMQVRRGVEDTKAFEAGLNNTTTAEDLMILLRAVATGKAASAPSCSEMIGILRGQEHRTVIPAGLPSGIVVAHKTGQISTVLHDAAIVDPLGPSPYVLVLLSTRRAEPTLNTSRLVELSSRIFEIHTEASR